MKIYLVGGAVRDQLLGLPFEERDWVVVGADEQQMLDLGYRRADADFPVFLHPDTGEEYALARRETKTGAGYKGFAVETGPDVTLEQDLARRDLTINAMAQADDGTIIDPYNGRKDLDERFLRHVTPAFVEDPLRLLRVARFAAKLGSHGFRLAHATFALMKQMAAPQELASLKPERVWREMKKALAEPQPWRFFETLQRCGALAQLMPELSHGLGQGTSHDDQDGDNALAALKRAVAAGASPEVRFAVLLATVEGDAGVLCRQLRVEKAFAELLTDVRDALPVFKRLPAIEAPGLLAFVQRHKARQRPEHFARVLVACSALQAERAEQRLSLLHAAVLALSEVHADTLLAQGLSGAELGAALQREREAALTHLLQGPAAGC